MSQNNLHKRSAYTRCAASNSCNIGIHKCYHVFDLCRIFPHVKRVWLCNGGPRLLGGGEPVSTLHGLMMRHRFTSAQSCVIIFLWRNVWSLATHVSSICKLKSLPQHLHHTSEVKTWPRYVVRNTLTRLWPYVMSARYITQKH